MLLAEAGGNTMTTAVGSLMEVVSTVITTITGNPTLMVFFCAGVVGMVLCQDLVQVKMRNFSHFNLPEAQPQCVFFYTIVRIHLVTYSYNGYEFVSYCRKLPDIRKSSGMPACNREF